YRAVVRRYYDDPGRPAAFELNPLLAPVLAIDPPRIPLPLSRFDCVLTEAGELRVIELNPIGASTIHLPSAPYVAHVLRRASLEEDASLLDILYQRAVASFDRFYKAHSQRAHSSATIGMIVLGNMHRGTRLIWRSAFMRQGWRFIDGRPDQLELT